MSRRMYVRFLMAAAAIFAVAAVMHLFGGDAMRALGTAIHGRP